MKSARHLALMAGAMLALAGCSVAPPLPAVAPLAVPPAFHAAPDGPAMGATAMPDTPAAGTPPWWSALDDPQLNTLIDLALRNNRDLRIAGARIDQARALADVDQAARGLALGLNPQASRSRASSNTSAGVSVASTSVAAATPAVSVTPNTYHSRVRLPLDAAYEADVWGRLSHAAQASQQRAAASTLDLLAARQSLVTAVITGHHMLLTHQAQAALLQDVVHLSERRLQGLRTRVSVGLANGAALWALHIGLADALAQAQRMQERVALDRHALALLCGVAPGALPVPQSMAASAPLPVLPTLSDIPSSVLLRRPDVRSAQAQLDAALSDVGAARADFFPTLKLTTGAGLESSALATLLQPGSAIWSLAAQISVPWFDSGRRNAQFTAAQARLDEAAQRYESTVLQALREVEDALTTAGALQALVAQEALAYDAAMRRTRHARQRAEAGFDAPLGEIELQQAALQRKLSLLDAQAQAFVAQTTLRKVLAQP